MKRNRFGFRVKFEPRDVWVGVYWDVKCQPSQERWLFVYVCVVPMFPVSFRVELGE